MIDNAHFVVPGMVKVAFFANDVSHISSHQNKLDAKELPRVVAEWSTSKKTVLNAGKCEVTFFLTNSHEANSQPTIIANNNRLLAYLDKNRLRDAGHSSTSPRRSGGGESTGY